MQGENRRVKTRKTEKIRDVFSEKFLLDHLRELASKLGRTPFGKDVEKAGKVTYAIYYKRFGSLMKAQKAAGLAPTKTKETPKYTEEELLNYLREMAKKLGRSPKIKDIIADGKVSIAIFNKRFRKFSRAVERAGLVPNKSGNHQPKQYV